MYQLMNLDYIARRSPNLYYFSISLGNSQSPPLDRERENTKIGIADKGIIVTQAVNNKVYNVILLIYILRFFFEQSIYYIKAHFISGSTS